MSKNKYPDIFWHQIEAIVFITLQICFATHTVLKLGKYPNDIPQFQLENIQSGDAFRPIASE